LTFCFCFIIPFVMSALSSCSACPSPRLSRSALLTLFKRRHSWPRLLTPLPKLPPPPPPTIATSQLTVIELKRKLFLLVALWVYLYRLKVYLNSECYESIFNKIVLQFYFFQNYNGCFSKTSLKNFKLYGLYIFYSLTSINS